MNAVQNVNAIVDIFGNILSFEVVKTNGTKEILPYKGHENLEIRISEYIVPSVKKAKFLNKNKNSLEITFQNGKSVTIDETKMTEFGKEFKKFLETGNLDNRSKQESLFSYLVNAGCKRFNCSKEDMRKEPMLSFFRNMIGNINAKSSLDGLCDLAIRTCGLEQFVKRKDKTFYGPNEGVPDKNGIKKVIANTDILGNVMSYTTVMFNGEIRVMALKEARALGINGRETEKKTPTIKGAKYFDKEKTKLILTSEKGETVIIDCSTQTYVDAIRNYMANKTFIPHAGYIDVFSYMAQAFCVARNYKLQDIAQNQNIYQEFSAMVDALTKKIESMPLDEIIIRECRLERFFKSDRKYVSRVAVGKQDTLSDGKVDLKRKGIQGHIYQQEQPKKK